MSLRPVVYVAGPYRDPRGTRYVELNIRAAEEAAVHLWQIGYAVICPHANTRHFDGACPGAVWLDGDLAILRRCDAVVMLPGWERSQGAGAERDFANANGIPVWYWPRDALRLADLLADFVALTRADKPLGVDGGQIHHG